MTKYVKNIVLKFKTITINIQRNMKIISKHFFLTSHTSVLAQFFFSEFHTLYVNLRKNNQSNTLKIVKGIRG